MPNSSKLSFLFFFLFSFNLTAQIDSIPSQNISEVTVTALKINTDWLKSPLAISRYQATALQEVQQQLSLQEYLTNIPGLFSLNAQNFAQDLRISIRGFGARAAFGIRGIKIMVDGIPETTPDGQGQIDNLNLGAIQNMDIIKGAASVLYGNAAGGVIQINTLEQFDANFLEAGLTFGSYQLQQYQLKGGFQKESTSYIFQGNYTATNGYRAQSGVKNTNLNARIIHQFSPKAKLNLLLNYTNSPEADDPGGINLDAVEADRRQARDRNVLFKTGEAIQQFKAGIRFSHQGDQGNKLQSYAFYSNRDFSGKLPFEFGGAIDLNRNYFGHGSSYGFQQSLPNGLNKIQVGYEIAHQQDDRQRFRNIEGIIGDQTLDQIESFTNTAVYLLDYLSINKWLITGGLRYDWNQLQLEDQFLSNGNADGKITLSSFNPSIGLSYSISKHFAFYANYRSSFETPSLSELLNNPNGNSGFNPDLKPQESNNFEVGWKGHIALRWSFDLAYFHINTTNELVPFELEAFPERDFFRNAGSTTRDGIEINAKYHFTPQWFITGSYTYSDFRYEDFELDNNNLSGKQLPGVPKHFGALSLNHINKNGFIFRIQSRYNGALFTSDSNEVEDEEYLLVKTNIGYRIPFSDFQLLPFFGINNLTNVQYNDNIRINAFGNRFYEPGPTFNFYGGVRLRWNKNKN